MAAVPLTADEEGGRRVGAAGGGGGGGGEESGPPCHPAAGDLRPVVIGHDAASRKHTNHDTSRAPDFSENNYFERARRRETDRQTETYRDRYTERK